MRLLVTKSYRMNNLKDNLLTLKRPVAIDGGCLDKIIDQTVYNICFVEER